MQLYTSERTSRKQVPALLQELLGLWSPGDRNADIGGGRWDLATELLAQHGITNILYDPFNRSDIWNRAALFQIRQGTQTATVANVLNVIRERDRRLEVIKLARFGEWAYFSIYEGDRSGVGTMTRDGWQENRRTSSYLTEIAEVFPYVEPWRGYIRASL